jgi:hypothetical protein
MSGTKNFVIALLALSTLGAAYLAWSEAREIAGLRASLAAANNPRLAARKQARTAATDASSGESELAAAEKAKAAPETAAGAVRHDARFHRPNEADIRKIFESPEYQRLAAIEQKGRLDVRYAALFKKLGLSQDQLDKFKDLLVEKQSSVMDVLAAARAQGLNPRTDPQGFGELVRNAQNDIDATIRTTLGDSAFATYKAYEQTLPYRGVVDQLDQRLSYSASPLTDAQSEQLAQIVADTNTGPTRSNNARPFFQTVVDFRSGGMPPTPLNPEAMNRAQGILTPAQFTALQQLQQEQQAQARMRAYTQKAFQQARTDAPQTPHPAAPAAAPAQ